MDVPPHERLVICPYNSTHVVVAKRLSRHLKKCQLTHSTKSTSTCRFNISHVFANEEIELHEINCPDRILVDRFVLDFTLKQKKKEDADWMEANDNSNNASESVSFDPLPTKITKKSRKFCHEVHEECWDDDKTPTYNPHQAIAARKKNDLEVILINIQNGTPSERRRLRDCQRIEYQKIQLEKGIRDLPAEKNESYTEENSEVSKTERGLKKKRATNCFTN